MKRGIVFILLILLSYEYGLSQTARWDTITTVNQAIGREEGSFVNVGEKFVLLGGRIFKPTQHFTLSDSTWTTYSSPPLEIHHFQAVNYHNVILILGAMSGGFPAELPVPKMGVYDPITDIWHEGADIPLARQRGSAGVVLHDGLVYMIAGITNGHISGWSKKFDVFDPTNGEWTSLADAPQERDHFHAIVADNKIYCAGGRMSGAGVSVQDSVISQVDYYDLLLQQWFTLPPSSNIPTGRAGCAATLVDGNIMICGGESIFQGPAHDDCEILNTTTNTWSTTDNLMLGRHGTQIARVGDFHFMAAGVGYQGGAPRWGSIEVYRDPNDTLVMPPAITVATYDIDECATFQNVSLGDSLLREFTISHRGGNQAILIDSIGINTNSQFSIESSHIFPVLIPPGEDLVINVNFERATPGLVIDTLDVFMKIPHDSVFKIILNATNTELPLIYSSVDTACYGDTVNLWVEDNYQSYLWSGGSVDTIASIVEADNVIVTVQDAEGCTYTNSMSVNYKPFLGVVSAKQFIRCDGLSDGRLIVNGFGGTAPYSYQWDDADSTSINMIDSLGPGIYTVTVSDDFGCESEHSFVMTEPAEILLVSILDSPQPGDVNLLVTGGINPYTYSWSNGATTEDLLGAPSGTYFVTVRDRFSCAKVLVVTVP